MQYTNEKYACFHALNLLSSEAHITFDYIKIRYCRSNTLTVSFRQQNYKEFHIRRSFQCNTLTKYDEEKQKMINNVYLTKITLTWNVIPNTWWICNNIIVMAHSVGRFTVYKLEFFSLSDNWMNIFLAYNLRTNFQYSK